MSSRKDSVPRGALEQCFRELPDYVVLRNEEDVFGHLERGGDLDLLVGNLELAERTLIRHLGCPIRITRRSYVREYFYDWGSVDLLPCIEWRGACYLRTDSVFDGRHISERGRPVPRLAHVAVISWFSSLLWGGFFKDRYTPVIRQAVEADGVAFRQALTEAAGSEWGDCLWRMAAEGHPQSSATWAFSLRRALWWRAFVRSPLRTIQRYCSFVIRELSLRFKPPVPWIAILGSDRNRCSAIVSEIVDRFSQSPYAHVKAIPWFPRTMERARHAEPTTVPYGRFRRAAGSSRLRLLVSAAWFVNYWTRWVHVRAKGFILAVDSDDAYPFADSWRYRSGLRQRLARMLGWLLPQPEFVFLLDSASEGLPQHPHDDAIAELARKVHAQTAAAGALPDAHVLNGNLPASVHAQTIQRVIRAWMLDRTSASLGDRRAPIMAGSRAGAEGSNGVR